MPNHVVCGLCGGKFFKSSLPHHQKVCAKKIGKQCHECPYCHSMWPMLEMDAHILTCDAARSQGARPTGASAALRKRLNTHQERLEKGLPADAMEEKLPGSRNRSGGMGGMGGMGGASEYGDDEDTRVECQFCGRKFAMDRIGKHQAICQKIANKRPVKPKLYHKVGPSRSAPKLKTSNWKKQSEDFRAACRAARGEPVDDIHDQDDYDDPDDDPPTPPPASRTRQPQRTAPRQAASTTNRRPKSEQGQSAMPAAVSNAAEALVREQFKQLDTDGDGTLSPEEMEVFLRTIDPGMSDSDLDAAFNLVDKDLDGRVDFDEFVAYVFNGASKQSAAGSGTTAARQRRAPLGGARSASPHAGGGGGGGRGGGGGAGRSVVGHDKPRRSAGAVPDKLPAWGSPEASKRWGLRDCMTSPPPRTTPHNTSYGGCAPVAASRGVSAERTFSRGPGGGGSSGMGGGMGGGMNVSMGGGMGNGMGGRMPQYDSRGFSMGSGASRGGPPPRDYSNGAHHRSAMRGISAEPVLERSAHHGGRRVHWT